MSTNPNKGSRPGFNQNAHPFVYHQPTEQPPTVSATGSDAGGYHPTQQATVYQSTLSAHPTQVSAGTIRQIAPTAPPTPPQQDTGTRLPQQPQTMPRHAYMQNIPSQQNIHRNAAPQQTNRRLTQQTHQQQQQQQQQQHHLSQMYPNMAPTMILPFHAQGFGAHQAQQAAFNQQMQPQLGYYTTPYFYPQGSYVPATAANNAQRPGAQNTAPSKIITVPQQNTNMNVAAVAAQAAVAAAAQSQSQLSMGVMGVQQPPPHPHIPGGPGSTGTQPRRKRENAIAIVDPKTGLDVMEQYLAETTTTTPAESKENVTADPAVTVGLIHEHMMGGPDSQSAQISMVIPSPDLLINQSDIRLSGLTHQQQQHQLQQHLLAQSDLGQSTPVVSANADGPSIDITPKQPLNKNKKNKNLEQISLGVDSSNKSSDNSHRQQTGAGEIQQSSSSNSIYQPKQTPQQQQTSSSGDSVNYPYPETKDEQTKPTAATASDTSATVVVTEKTAHELPNLESNQLPQQALSDPKKEVLSPEQLTSSSKGTNVGVTTATSTSDKVEPSTAVTDKKDQEISMKMEKVIEVVKSTLTPTSAPFITAMNKKPSANGNNSPTLDAEVATTAPTATTTTNVGADSKNNKKSNRNLLNNNSNLNNNNKPSIVETDKPLLNANRIENNTEKLDYIERNAKTTTPTEETSTEETTSDRSQTTNVAVEHNTINSNSNSNRSSTSISNSSSSTSISGKNDETIEVSSTTTTKTTTITKTIVDDTTADSDLTNKMNKLNIINSNIRVDPDEIQKLKTTTNIINNNLGKVDGISTTLNNNNNNDDNVSKLIESNTTDIGNNNSIDILEKLKSSRNDTTDTSASAAVPAKQLLDYSEGQWRPDNQEGRKFYTREQMIALCQAPESQQKPKDLPDALKTSKQTTGVCMPRFASVPAIVNRPYQKRSSQQGGGPGGGGGGGGRDGGRDGGNNMLGMGGGSRSQQGMKPGIKVISLQKGVELDKAENAWKPKHLNSDASLTEEEKMTNETVRSFRSILNKLTPENFAKLVLQVQELPIDSYERLKKCIELVFEKAIAEPIFSVTYAQLCQQVSAKYVPLQTEKKNITFKNLLITQCQTEFTTHGTERRGQESKTELALENEQDQAKRDELKLAMEETERKIRRRAVGTVRFIGELFKIEMLTIRIMNQCISILLDYGDEDSLECLCKLLTTIGKRMEKEKADCLAEYFTKLNSIVAKSNKQQGVVCSRIRFMIQDVIDLRRNNWAPRRGDLNPKTMGQIQKDLETEHMNINMINYQTPSRKSDDRRDNRGGGGGGGGGGGYNKGNQQNDEGWKQPNTRNRAPAFDPSKLSLLVNKIDNNTTLGSASMYQQWNRYASLSTTEDATSGNSSMLTPGNKNKEPYHSKGSLEGGYNNSGNKYRDDGGRSGGGSRNSSQIRSRDNSNTRPVGGPSRSLQPPSQRTPHQQPSSQQQRQTPMPLYSSGSSSITAMGRIPMSQPIAKVEFEQAVLDNYMKKFNSAMLEYLNTNSLDSSALNEMAPVYHSAFVTAIHELVLDKGEKYRQCTGVLITEWLQNKKLSIEDYRKGISEYNKTLIETDAISDIPMMYVYFPDFVVLPLYKKLITLVDIKVASRPIIEAGAGCVLLGHICNKLSKEHGPAVAREIWNQSKCKVEDFLLPEKAGAVNQFVSDNKLEFIINSNAPPSSNSSMTKQQLTNYIRDSLNKDVKEQEILDCLQANVKTTTDKDFIRTLTTAILEYCIDTDNKLKPEKMERCSPLLENFIPVGTNESSDLPPHFAEMECICAVQRLLIDLQHPPGLAISILANLYDNCVISAAGLLRWRDSSEVTEQQDKGVVVRSCLQLFLQAEENLKEGE